MIAFKFVSFTFEVFLHVFRRVNFLFTDKYLNTMYIGVRNTCYSHITYPFKTIRTLQKRRAVKKQPGVH